MVRLQIVVLLLNSFIGTRSDPFFFEAFESLKNKASSMVAEAGLSHLNPMRMLEAGPEEPCPEVKTAMGKVKGIAEFSRDKTVFFSYLGIPYAKPPIKNLRFESPKAWDEEWDTTRETIAYGPPCLQFDMVMAGGITGSENCLLLNVFSSNVDPGTKNPVIVIVHGTGIGMEGNSQGYHPKYFMANRDIVFVSFNYRLGALGFLNSGDGTVKGNMALKDQQLALKWVQTNIQQFGGDPLKVTLLGDSTGAVSAHFLALSESSKGLFSRAILQSGHALSPWGFTSDHVGQFRAFSENFDCPQHDMKYWLICMKNKDAMEIVEVHSSSESPLHNRHEIFTVTVEKPEEFAIVTQNPFATLQNGNFSKIPLMFGVNQADGAVLTSRIEAHDEIKKTLSISWNTYVPILLNYIDNTKISRALRRHYFPTEDDPAENFTPVMQMITDADFLYPLHQVLEYYRKTDSEVYVYFYSYKGQNSIYPALKSYKKESFMKGQLSVATSFATQFMSKSVGGVYESDGWGPVFMDQILTLYYYSAAMEIIKESPDYEFSKTFVNGLVDFVKENKNLKFANVDWPPLKKEGKIEMMTIDKNASMVSDKFRDIVAFYEGLHIRDPAPQIAKPVESELKKGDITPIG